MTVSVTLHAAMPAGTRVRLCDPDMNIKSQMTVELDSVSITMYGCPDFAPGDHVVLILDPPPVGTRSQAEVRLRLAADESSRRAGAGALRLLKMLTDDLRELAERNAQVDPADLRDRILTEMRQADPAAVSTSPTAPLSGTLAQAEGVALRFDGLSWQPVIVVPDPDNWSIGTAADGDCVVADHAVPGCTGPQIVWHDDGLTGFLQALADHRCSKGGPDVGL